MKLILPLTSVRDVNALTEVRGNPKPNGQPEVTNQKTFQKIRFVPTNSGQFDRGIR